MYMKKIYMLFLLNQHQLKIKYANIHLFFQSNYQ